MHLVQWTFSLVLSSCTRWYVFLANGLRLWLIDNDALAQECLKHAPTRRHPIRTSSLIDTMSYGLSPTTTFHSKTYPTLSPTRPELSAKGKNVIITGGGTGIGAETARYYAQAGASRIAILGRREQPLLETKDLIEREHARVDIL